VPSGSPASQARLYLSGGVEKFFACRRGGLQYRVRATCDASASLGALPTRRALDPWSQIAQSSSRRGDASRLPQRAKIAIFALAPARISACAARRGPKPCTRVHGGVQVRDVRKQGIFYPQMVIAKCAFPICGSTPAPGKDSAQVCSAPDMQSNAPPPAAKRASFARNRIDAISRSRARHRAKSGNQPSYGMLMRLGDSDCARAAL
jgi:hypothetical protein